jgi:prepilin-type N-terminal cleavage/methylation domain-containing protein
MNPATQHLNAERRTENGEAVRVAPLCVFASWREPSSTPRLPLSPSASPVRGSKFQLSAFNFQLSSRAFSLIELIGVLAVIAILAALTAPRVIKQIDEAAWTKERDQLAGISNSIVLSILNNKAVPSDFRPAVASWIQQPQAKIDTNPRRNARGFMIDTAGWLGTTTLPWTQTVVGATAPPQNARIMIVSSMGRVLPGSVFMHGNFQDVWDTPERTKPSVWTNWPGRGEDLVIQRITLDPLFHRLALVNRDPLKDGRYSIQPSITTTNLPPNLTRTSYFLNGTDLTLLLPDGVPQERVQLTRDASYAFSGSRWGGDYYGSGYEEDTAQGFAYWAFRFMKAGPAPTAQQGATPEGTVSAMYDFMLVFSLWANKCFDSIHFPQYGSGPESTTVPEYILLLDIAGGGTKTDSSFLNDFSGEGGLLNPP